VILIVAVLLVVVLGVLGVAGLGPLALGGDDERVLGRGSGAVVVAGGAVVVVVVLALVATVGLRGGVGGDDEQRTPAPRPTVVTTTSTTTGITSSTTTSASSQAAPADAIALGPAVRIDDTPRAIGELAAGTVLRVRVDGFPAFAVARARQCAGGRCGNPIDVQFGEGGTASFQYLVVDDFVPAARAGGCRLRATPCSIVVENVDGDGRAELVTVFGGPLPAPGHLDVTPSARLAEGTSVAIELSGFPPDVDAEVVLCAAPDTAGAARCGSPGPVIPVHIGDDGRARASLLVRTGPVGTERIACGRDHACAVVVRSPSAFVRSNAVRLGFAAPPGVDYDARRLLAGLGIALVLAAIATWLVLRTDWAPIGEEAAPEIDEAEYADLDAIIAALPPEDELESASTSS
jgi:hypothetical protein